MPEPSIPTPPAEKYPKIWPSDTVLARLGGPEAFRGYVLEPHPNGKGWLLDYRQPK